MKYRYLATAAFCTFVVLLDFDGSVMSAVVGAFAVLNFGLFVSA